MKTPDVSRFSPADVSLYEVLEVAPGPSLVSVLELSRHLLVVCCVVIAAGVLMMLSVDVVAIRVVGLGVAVAGCVAVWVLPFIFDPRLDRARDAELALGYTTSPRGFAQFPEVDRLTARVIRLPDEPFLNDADRDERRREMRATPA